MAGVSGLPRAYRGSLRPEDENLRPSKGGAIVRLKKINFAGKFRPITKCQNQKEKFWVGNRRKPKNGQKRVKKFAIFLQEMIKNFQYPNL
jgi:hypothetical protein